MSNFYDKDGSPLTLMEWAERIERPGYNKVALDTLQDGQVLISTVWIGLDQSNGAADKPLIFETMVFSQISDDTRQERYSTVEEALAGHNKIVQEES